MLPARQGTRIQSIEARVFPSKQCVQVRCMRSNPTKQTKLFKAGNEYATSLKHVTTELESRHPVREEVVLSLGRRSRGILRGQGALHATEAGVALVEDLAPTTNIISAYNHSAAVRPLGATRGGEGAGDWDGREGEHTAYTPFKNTSPRISNVISPLL